jgi:hypothetical protein
MPEIILRSKDAEPLIFVPCPVSAWQYLLFIEKSQTPQTGGSPRAIGSMLSQAWLYCQAYTLNGEPLTELKLTALELSMREANRLFEPIANTNIEIEILDGADTYEESEHLDVGGAEYRVKSIPWEASDRWMSDVRISIAQAYKNMIKSYITRDETPITDTMLANPAVMSMEEGKVLFDLVKYAVN